MSVAVMSEPGNSPSNPSLEDVEKALVLAREVATATAKGGAANIRVAHLRQLFENGSAAAPARIQAALEAAGLSADPPLTEEPVSVALRVQREVPVQRRQARERDFDFDFDEGDDEREGENEDGQTPMPRSGVEAYRAVASVGKPRREPAPLTLADMERLLIERGDDRTAQSIAALMPALIVPVLAASFLGPVFGAIFAGLALLVSAMLSRPGALAHGRLGPLRMPATLARSFLLVTFFVSALALGLSLALVAAGGSDTNRPDESKPIQRPTQRQSTTTTPPAPPANTSP